MSHSDFDGSFANGGLVSGGFIKLQRLFSAASHHSVPIRQPDKAVESAAQSVATLREAAVLIPIIRPANNQPSEIVLTVRSDKMKRHAGQVSLPGGTADEQDKDAAATALREAEEEIGLAQQQVEVIGVLGQLAMPSGFRITPVVGLIDAEQNLVPCPIEVADIFNIPLELALDVNAYEVGTIDHGGQARKILELQSGNRRIWGATAAILHHLAQQVAAHADNDS
ncbi:MAG: CoA pyrophosphatase [Pseudohongiellaceae bacterium]